MSRDASKPTPSSPVTPAAPATPATGAHGLTVDAGPPGDEPQGSLGAVLIGAAILLVAGLLIFWPAGDSATASKDSKDGKGAQAQQSSNSLDGAGPGGKARGIAPRELDPVAERPGPRVREGVMAPADGMTLAPQPPPEPTSFPSVAAEIAHLEAKLVGARANLASRTVFLERMKKMQAEAPISDHQRTAQRARIVQENYDIAQSRVDDIQYRLNKLRAQ